MIFPRIYMHFSQLLGSLAIDLSDLLSDDEKNYYFSFSL